MFKLNLTQNQSIFLVVILFILFNKYFMKSENFWPYWNPGYSGRPYSWRGWRGWNRWGMGPYGWRPFRRNSRYRYPRYGRGGWPWYNFW